MNRIVPPLLLPLLFTTAALAAEPLRYDQISLSAQASKSIDNDTLVATLYTQQEGENAEALAQTVNRLMGDAVKHAKTVKEVKVQTLDYSTQPIYGKGSFNGASKLTGWRIRQSIRLESKNAPALSRLIADLQETLAVSNIGYTVSPERRRSAQDGIIRTAIANFNARAALISKEMKRGGYRVVNMSVNTTGYNPMPYQLRSAPMLEGRAKISAAPAMEAGTQQIQVNVTGTIELDAK